MHKVWSLFPSLILSSELSSSRPIAVVSKASKLITMFSIFRSVSYPTPTYYAHLVADRARKHHNELAGYECGGSTSGNSAGSVRLTEAEKRKIQEVLERGVAKPMYFV